MRRALVLLFVLACGPADQAPASAPLRCPVGQVAVRGTEGPHCVIPGDMVNVTPGCRPIVCNILAEAARAGQSNDGGSCAAACAARCTGDADLEREALEDAAALGVICEY